MNMKLKQMVRELNKRDYQVIPRNSDSKLPAVKWKHYHEQGYKNPNSLIESWLTKDYQGFCLLTGSTSNNLEILDFDTLSNKSNVFELFQYVAGDLIQDCPTVVSGGGGVHLYYRRETTNKSTKLAYKLDAGKVEENNKVFANANLSKKRKPKDDYQIVIETRCNKSYVVCPYSLHKSGKLYQPSLDTVDFIESIPVLSDEMVSKIQEIARTFNEFGNGLLSEADKEEEGLVGNKPKIERSERFYNQDSPINRYNAETNIDELLESFGYTYHSPADSNSLYYCRPGRNTIGVIIHIDQNRSWHFSDSDDLYCERHQVTPFDALCKLKFDGDVKVTVKELSYHYGMNKRKKAVVKEVLRNWG